ncbi:hypothetical protein TNCV_2061601 [Trichonephila clavipes]|nr:hypothetical protein TNCV_2061601 [Trichonephila clavipes]
MPTAFNAWRDLEFLFPDIEASGQDHGLVVHVSNLVPLKTRFAEELMRVKSVEAQTSPVGVEVCQLRCRPGHLTMVQKDGHVAFMKLHSGTLI